jgi:hypothetical protein
MVSGNVVILSVSLVTTGVGWILFVYLRNMRRKVRTHLLRNDDIKKYFARQR